MDKLNMNKITMGFIWNPDMPFDEFMRKNKSYPREEIYELYKKIEYRYIEEKFNK